MMFSRNVFCGATKPRRPPGILADFAAHYMGRIRLRPITSLLLRVRFYLLQNTHRTKHASSWSARTMLKNVFLQPLLFCCTSSPSRPSSLWHCVHFSGHTDNDENGTKYLFRYTQKNTSLYLVHRC